MTGSSRVFQQRSRIAGAVIGLGFGVMFLLLSVTVSAGKHASPVVGGVNVEVLAFGVVSGAFGVRFWRSGVTVDGDAIVVRRVCASTRVPISDIEQFTIRRGRFTAYQYGAAIRRGGRVTMLPFIATSRVAASKRNRWLVDLLAELTRATGLDAERPPAAGAS